MTASRTCPQCGTSLAADAAEGFCPPCLLKETRRTDPEATLRGAESADAQRVDPEPGTRVRYFGDYELIEEIARGGMGAVWKARQIGLNRIVALKLILGGKLATPSDVLRFRREAEAAANLQHPNIVAIHEIGEHEGQHFFSMDYVEGKSLAGVSDGNPLPARDAARYVKIIAEAIQFAHEHGTLHRDLKPQNVLIDQYDQPRITDFGLAKILGEESSLTMSGEVMGTPSYMAPEQAAGRHDQVGMHTDVYSLGAILYELLVGCRPFSAPTVMGTLQQVMEAEPQPLRGIIAAVPADLETICLKCLEKAPARRYASARELADDLGRFLSDEPILARPPGLLDRLDRWARLRPALASTLVCLTAFYFFHLVLLRLGSEGEGGFFHWFTTGLVAVWAAAAVAFQRWVIRAPREALPIYCWAAFDVMMLTLYFWQGDGPRSAMLIGYPLLIALSALRFQIGLLWVVTGLCSASYLGLVVEAYLRRPQFAVRFKDWALFTLGLLILGFVQRLLLRRLGAARLGER
jgi:eukaryotic-like serine/threonine-protein kinase